jgi:hypothetical protein
MAFGPFRKRLLEPAAPAVEPQAVTPTIAADAQGRFGQRFRQGNSQTAQTRTRREPAIAGLERPARRISTRAAPEFKN